MKRTIVIGDLHGCLDEALELLVKCNVTANDRVIFVGDLIDRGDDSAGCVDLAMMCEKLQGSPACVLGNHEERHIIYNDEERLNGYVNVTAATHVATRLQLKSEHYDYMRSLPTFIRLPEFNAAVVHAGAYPGRRLEEQDPRHLLHVSMLRNVDGKIGERTEWASRVPTKEFGWHYWSNYWSGPERLIFGHAVLTKPLITPYAVGIDGGCCFGLNMHAVILPEWEIVTVKSRKKSIGRDEKPSFAIHGDVRTY